VAGSTRKAGFRGPSGFTVGLQVLVAVGVSVTCTGRARKAQLLKHCRKLAERLPYGSSIHTLTSPQNPVSPHCTKRELGEGLSERVQATCAGRRNAAPRIHAPSSHGSDMVQRLTVRYMITGSEDRRCSGRWALAAAASGMRRAGRHASTAARAQSRVSHTHTTQPS